MISRKNLENTRLARSEDLCALVEKLGYVEGPIKQLQCNNGAFVSSLLNFFDDNPGAMEALAEWIGDTHPEVTDSEECGCCGEECSPDGMCITADCENYGNMWNDDGNEV
jgi:hypothetical protein